MRFLGSSYYQYLVIGIVAVIIMLCMAVRKSKDIEEEKEAFTSGIRKTYRPWVRHWRTGFTNMYTGWHKYFMAKMGRLGMN